MFVRGRVLEGAVKSDHLTMRGTGAPWVLGKPDESGIAVEDGTARLIGHYIEDDPLDAMALTSMLDGESGISLTTSTSLNDFEDWASGGELGFVLVDIYRPDSRSFEDEVERIRAYSNAPIFFITGDEAKFYVSDALEVGAKGVLEKEALTADGLLKVLKAAGAQCASENPEGAAARPTTAADREPSDIDPQRFGVAQSFLQDALRAACESATGAEELRDILGAIADAQLLLKKFAQVQSADVEPFSRPARIIRDLQRTTLSMARQRGIKFVFQTSASPFDEAELTKVSTCIRLLLKAVIIGMPRGTTVKFNWLSSTDGIRLSVSSDAPFQFETANCTEFNPFDNVKNLASTILIAAISIFLFLDSRKITVFEREMIHTIILDIRDS